MKISGKPKTPIIAAQSKEKRDQQASSVNGNKGGTKARTSRTSKSKTNGVKSVVLERISDGILALDAGLTYTYLNERAGELLGCKSDELIGRSLWQAHPDADGAPLAEACRRALETQTIVPLDGYFPASDRWLAGRVYPSAEGVSVLFMEGTQRKWEEIRDTSSLPEQNPNPVLRFTPQGEILYANPSAKTLLRAWENQDAQTTSLSEIQLLLPSVTDEGLTTDIEIVNEGKVYTGLLVPVKEHGYINLYLRDITERKQVEESLRAHINQTNAGITRTDLDGRFTFANQAFCDLLGYSEDELLGKTIWEISHSEDVAKNERLFERMVREGRSFQLEKRALRRNGSVLWVSVGTSPLRDAAGTIRAATSIVVDITRRKRAEESLLDSARRTLYLSSLSDAMRPLSDPSTIQIEALRLLGAHLKASRVAYIEMEPDGRAFVRDSYVDGIGKMGEQFNIDTFIPQSQRMDFRAGRVISASDVQSDSRFSESQKAEHESLGIAAEILYPFVRAGEVIAALCIQQSQPRAWKNEELSLVRETGERLQAAIEHAHAERKLRDSERRFRILSNTVPSVVWTASPNGTIEYANDIWYNYAGITPEQNATNWAELVLHPDDYERCVRAWTHALETVPDEYLIEVRNRRHDGVYRWFQTRAIPVRDEHGSVTAWYGVTTDIHERKAIEQEKNDLLEREQTLRLDAEQARIEAEQSKIKAEEELVERKLAEQALGQWADAPLPQETRSPWLRYGMAFAATAAAIGLRMLLDPVLGEYVQYTLLFAAVAFSVWYGGLGPALFSAIFGYLGISWFIMDWQHILNPNAADLTGFVIFLFSTVIIMFLGSAMRRAQRHAHQSARVAVARQRQAELHLIEQKRVEEALRESEQRFRDIFETAGVSVWVEDFSAVTQAIEELRTQGVQDFRAYFLQHPDFVRKAVDLVQILDVNQETLRLFGAKNKDELLHSLSNVFLPETEAVFLEELVTLAEGQAVMRAETQLHTLDDRLITVLFTVHFNPQVGDTRRVVVTLTDITERKHMEQALEHEKQLFKLLFETMPVMVSLYDPESNTLRLNAEFERALGWRDEEVTVQSLLEYLYPDIEYRNQILQRMAAAGRNDWVEVQVQARDGRTLDSLWSNISIMNDKQIVSGIAIGIDITERKQDELALRQYARQQEALYELTNRLQHTKSQEDIYNAAQDAILYALQCDRASILLFDDTDAMHFVAWRGLSDEYRTATDGHSPWKRDEKDPEPISMADIDAAELSDSLKAIIKEEGIASLAFIPLVSNGQLIGKFMAYFNTPHDWSDREIDLGQTIARQLATAVERKRADDALHASEERFAQFMQYLPGLAWIKDIQGRYVYANAAAEKAFGTLREDLYGRTDAEVFPAEIAAQFKKNDELTLLERGGLQVIETLDQDDGLLHSSLVTKFPIPGPDGSPVMIGGTAFDITERIQMEGALQQARERAEETADRMARLQVVTAALAEVLTPAQLAELILEQGTRATGAAASILVELVNDGRELKTVAALGYPAGAIRIEPVPLSRQTPMSDCLQKKQAMWIRSHEEFAERYPSLAELRRGFGNEATVALPLIVGDRVLGGLAFSFVEKREFLLEERGFLLAVAQQCAQGLERANTTEALRESEERHRALINQTTAGIIRKDANGKILFVNGAFCQMLGCSESDLVGKTMWQITHELDVVENRRLYNRLIAEGTPFELEKRLLRKDGSILWATVSVSPVLDTDGKPKSAVSVYTDITERKQTETALNESRERFRNLFNLVPVAVYTCDAEGLIQEFNRSAVELWGREPYTNDPSERYCGSFKIFYPDGRFMPHKNCPMARMLNGETLDPSELEIVVERPDGSRRNVIAHPLPLKDESGRIVGAINCLYDMTERRQAERGLSLLVEVSDLTRRFEDSSELMSAVAETVGRYFHVRRSLFNEIDIEKNLEIVHNDYHDGIESVEGVHKLTDYSEVTSAEIMAGKTIVNTDSKTDPRTAQDYERSYLPTGERAYVAVPLMRGERWVASLWISDDAPRQWSREDVSLLETVAERTWTASEKLRIHAALRDSEERLRVTFNTTAVGFATLTPDTYFVDINEAFCSIVGYSREELLGMNFSSLTHPDYLKSTQDHIAALLNGEVPSFTIEKLYIRRDGREVWLQNSVSLVRDADGNPLHLIAIIQDVTERRETEDALYQLNLELEARVLNRTAELQSAYEFLRESEATSRLILESMPDAIVITDQDGKIVHANTQVESLFGYSPSEVLGQEVEILLPERYHRQHIKNREFYANQRGRRIMGLGLDLYGRRKDESEFPVDVMLSPINNNTTWDVMVSIRDNTKQRQAQEALRINEEKLRTLFEILPVGISFLDKEGRISDLNPALTEIVGLPKNELMRGIHQPLQFIRTDGSLMPPGELASTRARLEQKTIYNVETGIARANGEIRWTSVSAAPVQVADVEAAVVTVDITERKQAEETLHNHRERLKVLSRRLVEVQEEERRAIARELHDRVGQNLAALTLNLNILRNQLSSEALQKIGTRLNDSVSLVNDILGITRNVMADLRPNVLDDYGLDAALNEYADRYTQRFGIQVSTNFPDHPTPRLDPGIEMTLLRIAQEALTNIARHSKANKATVSLEMENDAVLLKVEDNGTGILSWQKVNQPGSHGLKIMRERAEAFGGSLKVNSAYKSGTIIEARIPLGSSTRNKVSQEKRS